MLQEDSNGEGSFEIIDRKADEQATNGDKAESLSSVSSPYSIVPSPVSPASGNALSNVAPPTTLPDFTLWQHSQRKIPENVTTSPPAAPSSGEDEIKRKYKITVPAPAPLPPNLLPPNSASRGAPPASAPKTAEKVATSGVGTANVTASSAPSVTQQFSAAIPPSKGIQYAPANSALDTEKQQQQQQGVPSSAGDPESGTASAGGLISWMKGAVVSHSGILSKVAEKARSSVDTLITTLDPQMSEFIYSGGDTELTVVVSNDLDEIVPAIRDAIYTVLGKAWVNAVGCTLEEPKSISIGHEAAYKRAKEKIDSTLRQIQNKSATIACENFLVKLNESYFAQSLLLLKDAERNIAVHTYTQTIPIPVDLFEKQAKEEIPDFLKSLGSGGDSTEKLLASYLQVCKNNWQQTVGGVSHKESLNMAAKVLIHTYKNKLVNQ